MITGQIGDKLFVNTITFQLDWCEGCLSQMSFCYVMRAKKYLQNPRQTSLLWAKDMLNPGVIGDIGNIYADEIILSFPTGFDHISIIMNSTMIQPLRHAVARGQKVAVSVRGIADAMVVITRAPFLRDADNVTFMISNADDYFRLAKIVKNVILLTFHAYANPRMKQYLIVRKPVTTKDALDYAKRAAKGVEGITLDRCILDESCEAGVTNFHVWPDGTVTGCPYAFVNPDMSQYVAQQEGNLEERVRQVMENPPSYCPAKDHIK